MQAVCLEARSPSRCTLVTTADDLRSPCTDSHQLTPPTDHLAATGSAALATTGLGLFARQVDRGPGDQVGGLSGDQWAAEVAVAWGVGPS